MKDTNLVWLVVGFFNFPSLSLLLVESLGQTNVGKHTDWLVAVKQDDVCGWEEEKNNEDCSLVVCVWMTPPPDIWSPE